MILPTPSLLTTLLVGLLFVALVVTLSRRSLLNVSPRRRIAILAVRILFTVLVIAALAESHHPVPRRTHHHSRHEQEQRSVCVILVV